MTAVPEPTAEQWAQAVLDLAGEAGDLSTCPYYAGYGDRICFQLWQCANPNDPEPHCQTDEPAEDWPLARHPEVWAYLIERLATAPDVTLTVNLGEQPAP